MCRVGRRTCAGHQVHPDPGGRFAQRCGALAAPRGQRPAGPACGPGPSCSPGGYWYVRNLVATGNPLPSLKLGIGPVRLPASRSGGVEGGRLRDRPSLLEWVPVAGLAGSPRAGVVGRAPPRGRRMRAGRLARSEPGRPGRRGRRFGKLRRLPFQPSDPRHRTRRGRSTSSSTCATSRPPGRRYRDPAGRRLAVRPSRAWRCSSPLARSSSRRSSTGQSGTTRGPSSARRPSAHRPACGESSSGPRSWSRASHCDPSRGEFGNRVRLPSGRRVSSSPPSWQSVSPRAVVSDQPLPEPSCDASHRSLGASHAPRGGSRSSTSSRNIRSTAPISRITCNMLRTEGETGGRRVSQVARRGGRRSMTVGTTTSSRSNPGFPFPSRQPALEANWTRSDPAATLLIAESINGANIWLFRIDRKLDPAGCPATSPAPGRGTAPAP